MAGIYPHLRNVHLSVKLDKRRDRWKNQMGYVDLFRTPKTNLDEKVINKWEILPCKKAWDPELESKIKVIQAIGGILIPGLASLISLRIFLFSKICFFAIALSSLAPHYHMHLTCIEMHVCANAHMRIDTYVHSHKHSFK